LSDMTEEAGHGSSPAAWTAVIIMLAAFSIATVAFIVNLPLVVWIGVALVFVGLIVGGVLAKMGYGAKGSKTFSSHDDD
jgi:hypothetical protein